MKRVAAVVLLGASVAAAGCGARDAGTPPRATGYVEATDVRVTAKIAGRVASVVVSEGARVEAGAVLATLAPTDVDFALARARAERAQAAAQVALLVAGSRPEDVRQADAQAAAAAAELRAAQSELSAARADEVRFDQLLRNRAGSQKQRDDAVARRELAEARVGAAGDRLAAAQSGAARVKSGARAEEIAAARARVGVVDAQIAALESDRRETTITAPSAGIIASRLVEPGEIVAPGAPVVVLIDLDRAWANVYLEETLVPLIKLDQPATIITDAGDRLDGRVSFISPRAEFTPRNVQTANERAKLVYRLKVTTDNRQGVLKPGMPVEVDLGLPVK